VKRNHHNCTVIRTWVALLTIFLVPAIQAQEVTSFTLVNAETNSDIRVISDGDELNLTELPPDLNIRANTDPEEVGSVRFDYEGNSNFRTENVFPYALRGDRNGNYYKLDLTAGQKNLTANPFPQGNANGSPGTSLSVAFTVVIESESSDFGVIGFQLIDASANELMGHISDGDVFDIDDLPDQINIKAITDPDVVGSVRFSFDGNSNFRTENVFPYTLAGDNNGNFYDLNIEPGTYSLTAIPFSGGQASGVPGESLTIGFTITENFVELPIAPSDLAAEVLGEEEVLLNWTDNSNDETSFNIERNAGGGFDLLATVAADETEYTDTDLTAGQTVSYRVRAVNSNGISAASNTVSVQTNVDVFPPANLIATAISNSGIQVEFTPPEEGDGFELQYSEEPDFSDVISLELPFSQTSLTLDNLMAGTTYFLRVRTERLGELSEWSNTAEATTNQDLAAPTQLSAEAIGTSEIQVSFIEAIVGDQYELEYDTDSEFENPTSVPIPFGDDGVVLSNLEASTTYFIRIRTLLDGLASDFSTPVEATTFDEIVLSAPSNLQAAAISTTEIEVSFDPAANADEYELQYALTQEFTEGVSVLIPGEQSLTVIDELTEGTTYFFRIRTLFEGESSDYSEIVSATTEEVISVLPPTQLEGTPISTSEIEVGFTPAEAGDNYELDYSVDENFAEFETVLIPFGENGTVLTGLSESTTYFKRIRTILGGEVSAYSSVVSTTTFTPEPSGIAVSGFSLIDAGTNQVIGDLTDGQVIQLAAGDQLTVRANTEPALVGSVNFNLNGQSVQTENVAPYALGGDSNGDYDPFDFTESEYTLTATPYTGSNSSGEQGFALTISFAVVEVTDPEIPQPPADLLATEVGSDGGVILTFTNAPAGDFYELDRATDIAFSDATTETVTFGAGSYSVNGLSDGTYFFRMRTSLTGIFSEYGNTAAVIIGENEGGVVTVDSEFMTWHPVTLSLINGPFHNETDNNPSPWKDYRLDVTFTHVQSGETFVVPGYFAVDGNAAESSAEAGSVWRCHFTPNKTGEWNYAISFVQGNDVALEAAAPSGTAILPYNGQTGSFNISASNKAGRDFRGKGRLSYVGKHHLQFEGNGEYFLKGGADAPENFLAYEDFDNTPNNGGRRKSWEPHAGDWNQGDPSWKNGDGTEIIGALNYLAEEDMNAFSFLTMNINGDDRNVYPYVSSNDRTHFDMSKMDQWDIVLAHGQTKGLYLHFKTQETENDQLLDGGALGTQRKLYYRMLVARFGYHLALNWNLGEENTNTTSQRIAFSEYIRAIDPYDHHIVVHTFPGSQSSVYNPLLGTETLTGVSIQTGWNNVYSSTKQWVQASANTSQPWVCANDEQGGANVGVPPDDGYVDWQTGEVYNASGTDQDDIRRGTLWGNLMAGGAGVEYYFGYQRPQSDLTCQDFRSRDLMWDYTRYALNFFKDNIAFQDLVIDSQSESDFWVLNDGEDTYVAYLRNGGTETIDVGQGNFTLRYYNPRTGEFTNDGITVMGPQIVLQGPVESNQDWAVLIEPVANGFAAISEDTSPTVTNVSIYPNPTRDFINVSSSNVKSLEIWTTEGRLVMSFSGNQNRLDVSELPNGIYILTIRFTDNRIESEKLIKQ